MTGNGISATGGESTQQMRLRLEAERLLERRAAPPSRGWVAGMEALTLLHDLASNPERASDALKLLHELQVHQVELDLQHEQIEQSRMALGEELEQYAEFYDHAPVGLIRVDAEGRIIEANAGAARIFGTQRDELGGRRIDSFLDPASRPAIPGLLQSLRNGGEQRSCTAQLDGAGSSRGVKIAASLAPSGSVLMALSLNDAC